jgi:ubiquitin carboxyl-terminal hydrolase 10
MNGVSDEDEKEPVDTDDAPEESGWETVNKPGVKEVVDDSSREDAVRKSASTLISRLFHGTLRSEVVYSNKKISSRFQIITQIQIELLELIGKEQKKPITNKASSSSSSSSINISDALKLYFAEEDLDNGARKRVKLENAPQILILHLKRFTFDYSKNIPIKINHDVHYDINLTIPMECLSPDLMANCIKNNQNKKVNQHNDSSDSDSDSDNDNGKNDIQNFNGIRYKLIGLILHHGLHATGGHYTSITKENDGTWKSMDDSTGSYISHGEALDGKKQVYLLFYEKI